MRLVLASIFLCTAFAVPTKADMSGNDIREHLIGTEIAWWELSGMRSGGMVLHPDGTAQIRVVSPDIAADKGLWSIDGDQLCTEWHALRNNRKCYSISQSGIDKDSFVTSGGNGFRIVFAGV